MPDHTFIARLSHELRSPLSAVMGLADLALLTHLSSEQREFLTRISYASESLRQLLDEAVEYSRIESGQSVGEAAAFVVRELLEPAFETWSARAVEAGIALRWQIAADVPTALIADSQHVGRIVDCLLRSAWRFTSEGSIEATVSLAADAADQCTLRLLVSDGGPAVAAGDLPRLLTPYYKVRRAADRAPHTALDLPIAALLAQGMGGELRLQGAADRGLTVECLLPIRKP